MPAVEEAARRSVCTQNTCNSSPRSHFAWRHDTRRIYMLRQRFKLRRHRQPMVPRQPLLTAVLHSDRPKRLSRREGTCCVLRQESSNEENYHVRRLSIKEPSSGVSLQSISDIFLLRSNGFISVVLGACLQSHHALLWKGAARSEGREREDQRQQQQDEHDYEERRRDEEKPVVLMIWRGIAAAHSLQHARVKQQRKKQKK